MAFKDEILMNILKDVKEIREDVTEIKTKLQASKDSKHYWFVIVLPLAVSLIVNAVIRINF